MTTNSERKTGAALAAAPLLAPRKNPRFHSQFKERKTAEEREIILASLTPYAWENTDSEIGRWLGMFQNWIGVYRREHGIPYTKVRFRYTPSVIEQYRDWDWSQRDVDLADQHGITRERVRQIRMALFQKPKGKERIWPEFDLRIPRQLLAKIWGCSQELPRARIKDTNIKAYTMGRSLFFDEKFLQILSEESAKAKRLGFPHTVRKRRNGANADVSASGVNNQKP